VSADPHFGFVIAAYGFGFLIVAGMTLLILRDYVNLKRALSRFDARTAHEDPQYKNLKQEDSKHEGLD
jgi:hypothetical protein